jgi:chromosome segregation ATPase
MAISPSSGTLSAGSAVWAQLQQQQAQRAADQAEQNARALQVRARDAESQAQQAQERARTIKVEYDQAEGKAGDAKQNVAALTSVQQLQDGMQAVRQRIASSTLTPSAASSAPAVVNVYGQQTGTVINVTA